MAAEEYIQRLSKVLYYIENNLNENLSLEAVSSVAAYSPFHFHRIFRFITKETLNQYITRVKFERSAFHLASKKEKSIKEIYLDFGFSSHAAFSKAFKSYYGINPSEFRKSAPKKFRHILLKESKKGQPLIVFEPYICTINELKRWSDMNLKIEITEFPEMHLASVLSIGIQYVESAYNTLVEWAVQQDLFPKENVKMISVYHDSFKTTSPDKVRIHAGILLDSPVQTSGKIFNETLSSGKYIVGKAEITHNNFEKAWTSLFLWMNENGYQLRRAFPFEIYHNNFKDHPQGKSKVDFCIPIK